MVQVGWSGMRDRVAALGSSNAAENVFGFSGHRFVLQPVLTNGELVAVEDFAGTRLPEAYRTFLLEVGNGGAGPGYGLERVVQTATGWRWTGHDVTTDTKLHVPFLPSQPSTYQQHNAAEPVESDFLDRDAFLEATETWSRRADDLYDEETYGTIALSHQGCGYYWLLVVSGPERGTMWDDSRAVGVPLSPLTNPTGIRMTFHQWYLDWLDRAEHIAATSTQPQTTDQHASP